MAARRLRNAGQRQDIEQELLQHETGDTSTGGGPLHLAVVYPNAYSVAVASLGFQRVRRLALDSGHARVERAFADPIIGRSLESQLPLGDFDLLLVSIAFEMDYPNVLAILDAAGLPIRAADRDASHPLVVVGGPATQVNRHPIAPYVDAIAHGDAELLIAPLLEAAASHPPREATQREVLLDALTEILGIETPARNLPQEEDARLPSIDPARCQDADVAASVADIVTPRAEFGRRILIEIARGCPHHCPFCWMGCQRRRPLAQPAERILAMLDTARERTDCADVGLIASAVGAHPEIDAICTALRERGMGISFSSLRAEEIRPGMLEALADAGQRSVTLAPEAGDEALRRTLGKNLPDARLFETIHEAQRAGLESLKLYFMLGLPGETDEAAATIPRLVAQTREILLQHGRPRGRLGEIAVNLGIYVPKPGTPMASRLRPHPDTTARRLTDVTRALRAVPNVRTAAAGMDDAAAQTILANGGLESAELVHALWQAGKRTRSAVRRYLKQRPHALDVGGFDG